MPLYQNGLTGKQQKFAEGEAPGPPWYEVQPSPPAEEVIQLEDMTKAQLRSYAEENGIEVPAGLTKADLLGALAAAPLPPVSDDEAEQE